jgi:hypothetical protein
MNPREFLSTVALEVSPFLSSAGFRRAAEDQWNRRVGEELNVIWFQKHSVKPLCCVNLGVHYTFLPTAGTGREVVGDEIEQPDCEIKERLTSSDSKSDQWWPLTQGGVDQMTELITSRAFDFFEAYKLDGGVNSVEAKEIELGTKHLLSSLTDVRACLLLARLHEHRGNKGACIEAASTGLRVAGRMAVGPRTALKAILERCERSA